MKKNESFLKEDYINILERHFPFVQNRYDEVSKNHPSILHQVEAALD